MPVASKSLLADWTVFWLHSPEKSSARAAHRTGPCQIDPTRRNDPSPGGHTFRFFLKLNHGMTRAGYGIMLLTILFVMAAVVAAVVLPVELRAALRQRSGDRCKPRP